ncbi:MAG: hypothetical protein ACPG8D_07050 [Luminiphilus sp.]
MILRIALVSMSLMLCATAVARPVSYAGGWTLIETSNRASTAGLVHYSPAHNFSVGLRHEWQRASDVKLTAIQPTLLVNRWFGREYQGNLYLTGGLGTAKDESPNNRGSETASFVGVMADWETRTLFVSYEARFLEQGALGNHSMHAARFGWAPYAGDTGELHTWLMLEVDRREHFEDKTSVTPLLRFFKGPALLELGYNLTDPSPLVNFTYRF